MRRQTLWVFVLSAWIGLLVQPIFAQSTRTPEPIRSIFDYDTCAPPCWLGLTPGESTPAEVEAALRFFPDVIPPESINILFSRRTENEFDIDPETGYIRSGTYNFDVGIVKHRRSGVTSRIDIENGQIDLIFVLAKDVIPLSTVLDRFGMPDIRYFSVSTSNNRIALVYQDLFLRVNLVQPKAQCDILTVLERMTVDSILYYSPEAAVRPLKTDHEVPQPALTGYRLLNDRLVPLEVWQTWIDGEVNLSCADAWAQLPEPEITPFIDITADPQS